MIGVLLVTHGQFCESMKESTEMVLGVQKNFYSLPLNPEDDIVCLQSRLLNKIQEMDQGEGVIVLVDLFGGSPYNAAFETVIGQDRMDVITGLSLPMLILGILENRERVSLEDLPEIGKQSGIAGIINVRKKIASLC